MYASTDYIFSPRSTLILSDSLQTFRSSSTSFSPSLTLPSLRLYAPAAAIEALSTRELARSFFKKNFSPPLATSDSSSSPDPSQVDILALMGEERVLDDFMAARRGALVIISVDPISYPSGGGVLLGDAGHSMGELSSSRLFLSTRQVESSPDPRSLLFLHLRSSLLRSRTQLRPRRRPSSRFHSRCSLRHWNNRFHNRSRSRPQGVLGGQEERLEGDSAARVE